MAKPSLTLRTTKGSALTFAEADANFTNLRDATISVTDGSTSTPIDLNGSIGFTAGSGISITNSSGTLTITNTRADTDTTNFNIGNGSTSFNVSDSETVNIAAGTGISIGVNTGTNTLTITNTVTDTDTGILNVVEDTTPQLGGTLDANGNTIDMGANTITDTKVGNWDTAYGWGNHATAGYLTSETYTGTLNNIVEDTTPQLGGSLDVNGQSIVSVSNGNIVLAPNGTGKTKVSSLNYNEGSLYDLGTTGGTVAPDVANGNVQKITLSSALTINGFTNAVAGQSVTLVIYGGTSYTSLTSTMKFAGGDKTLTGTAGCIDILSIYYDGTNYFASLAKGFA